MNMKSNRLDSIENKQVAFLQLLQNHKGILHKICRIYQYTEEDQQDLLQEMILQLWSSYDSFRGESQFSSWMYRVSFNTAIFFFKKKKQMHDSLKCYTEDQNSQPLAIPEDKVEQLSILYKAIRQLNKVDKALIFLYMEDVPGKEVAKIIGISESNVRTRISRVKDKLQYIIKTMGYEY